MVLVVAGFTDWLDGYLARAWNQRSRIGQLLDPVADRLYILAITRSLAIRGIIPWWLVIVLARPRRADRAAGAVAAHPGLLLAAGALPRQGGHLLPAVRLPAGAAGRRRLPLALVARVVGWAFALWGTGLYWWAGVLYVRQTIACVRSTPSAAPHQHR